MFDPARYSNNFEREHGSELSEWLRMLPEAVAARPLALGPDGATVVIGPGELSLRWQVLPPRQIALVRLPRLRVHYRFEGVPDDERARFLRFFDLYMQRGGG